MPRHVHFHATHEIADTNLTASATRKPLQHLARLRSAYIEVKLLQAAVELVFVDRSTAVRVEVLEALDHIRAGVNSLLYHLPELAHVLVDVLLVVVATASRRAR